MKRANEALVLNGAPSQLDRRLAALGEGYAPVDGRSLAELLAFAPRLGELIFFYDLENRVDGDWSDFYGADPSTTLASILALDLDAVEARFRGALRRAMTEREAGRKLAGLRDAGEAVVLLARRLDGWLRLAETAPIPTNGRWRETLRLAVVDELAEPLRALAAYDAGAGGRQALGRPLGFELAGLLPIWGLDNVPPDGTIYWGRDQASRIEHAAASFPPLLEPFLGGLEELQRFAAAELPASLKTADHRPQSALYLAFARLFEHAQATINTFARRYVDFYYRDVLRERHRGPVPDRLYLTFTLADDEDVARAVVPRDTLFPAGEDADGREILYAAEHDLTVTRARLERVRTLRMVTAKGSTAKGPEVQCEVLASRIPLAAKDDAALAGPKRAWPTFGPTKMTTSVVEVTRPAMLGFALASPYLLLTGGQREIDVTIDYQLQEEIPPRVLEKVLARAFELSLTSAGGWFPVPEYEVIAVSDSSFTLQTCLPPSAPAVVPMGADARSELLPNPDPSLPTLAVQLCQDEEACPLAILAGMEVTAFEIAARVEDLSDLRLENTDGEIDPEGPFLPFGGSPAVGSYLRVYHRELFVKTLDSLRLGLRWFDLPPNKDGFSGYYKDYVIGLDGKKSPKPLFDNSKFLGELRVLHPGTWRLETSTLPERRAGCACHEPSDVADTSGIGRQSLPYEKPVPGSEEVYLFRTTNDCAATPPDPCGRLCPVTVFEPAGVVAHTPPSWYEADASALELKLHAPDYAFGADLYTQNVLYAVLEDLEEVDKAAGGPRAAAAAPQNRALPRAVEIVARCEEEVRQCPEGSVAEVVIEAVLALELLFAEHVPAELAPMARALESSSELPVTARLKVIRGVRDELVRRINGGAASAGIPPAQDDPGTCGLPILEAALCVLSCMVPRPGAGLDRDELADCLECCRLELHGKAGPCETIAYPNEPWLPQAESLKLGYSAACTLVPGTTGACGRAFHLLPFGGFQELTPNADETAVPLLPRIEDEGQLLLGFTGFEMPQTLTLLFEMAALGGQDPLAGDIGADIEWSYLEKGRWQALPASALRLDTTRGLTTTGIVALALPALTPSDLQWLRASVKSGADRFPETYGITPHALTAVGVLEGDDGPAGEHLRRPLPAHTITGSVEDLPEIGSIDQPLASFGGRPPETRRTFDMRVGERLRHKDRAVLDWDYERLVLERFPAVWKVEVLPARDPQGKAAPGHVTVVVVPGPDARGGMDPTAPEASSDLLAEIRDYLAQRASPFVTFQVVNPRYVRIRVEARVSFRDEEADGASVERLNDELVEYLSPWFYDAARRGDYASEPAVAEFIAGRPYVLWVEEVVLVHDPPLETPGLEWCFLTSAKEHHIETTSTQLYQAI